MSRQRRWLVAVAAVAIVVAVVAGVLVLRTPRWTLRPLDFASPGEDVQPRAWSPDGTRYLFSRTDQFVVVRISDGARVLTGYGAWPVWVDDDTIDALTDMGLGRSQITRIELGDRTTSAALTPIFETPKLVGGGYLDLAATTNIGSIWATVVDPETGRVIAELPDVRAMRWARAGTLILKTSEINPGHGGFSPGYLRAWTAAGGLRPIGGELLEIQDQVSPSPSGDVIACVCVRPAEAPQAPGSIELVPVDGSPPTRLATLQTGVYRTEPSVRWLDDASVVFLDGAGLHRVGRDGTSLPVPTIGPDELSGKDDYGRSAVISGLYVVASAQGSGEHGAGQLKLRREDGTVELAASMPTWNGVWVDVHPTRPLAMVGTDPQKPGEAPERFFVLANS